jgi:hypothetical protein
MRAKTDVCEEPSGALCAPHGHGHVVADCAYKIIARAHPPSTIIRGAHRGAIVDISLAAIANAARVSRDRETGLYRHWHKDDL